MELGLTEGDIDIIEADQRDVGSKFQDVLREWMYTGTAKTDQLIDALRSPTVKRDDIADKILNTDNEQERKKLGLLNKQQQGEVISDIPCM